MLKRLSNLRAWVSKLNNLVLVILLFIALATSGLSLLINEINHIETSTIWWVSWLQNASTEVGGALLTYILIERIVGWGEKQQEEKRAREVEKAWLIRQMRSKVPGDAMRAVKELDGYNYDWLRDGSLRGTNLRGANLQELDLGAADLQGAALMSTNLRYTDLHSANLYGARLEFADPGNVILVGANLKRANLAGANLQGAGLHFTQLDETTTLPDSTHWTPDTDLTHFTDPMHINFWRSSNPRSPAYRGESGD